MAKETIASLTLRIEALEAEVVALAKATVPATAKAVVKDGVFECGVCGAREKGAVFCPNNPAHTTKPSGPAPDGEVTVGCTQRVGEERTLCGELFTGTRVQMGAWKTKCPKHRA